MRHRFKFYAIDFDPIKRYISCIPMSSSSSSSLVSNVIVFHLAAAIFAFISFDSCLNNVAAQLLVLLLLVRWSYRFHMVKLQIPLSLRLQKQCQTRVFRCQYEEKKEEKKKRNANDVLTDLIFFCAFFSLVVLRQSHTK